MYLISVCCSLFRLVIFCAVVDSLFQKLQVHLTYYQQQHSCPKMERHYYWMMLPFEQPLAFSRVHLGPRNYPLPLGLRQRFQVWIWTFYVLVYSQLHLFHSCCYYFLSWSWTFLSWSWTWGCGWGWGLQNSLPAKKVADLEQ